MIPKDKCHQGAAKDGGDAPDSASEGAAVPKPTLGPPTQGGSRDRTEAQVLWAPPSGQEDTDGCGPLTHTHTLYWFRES